MSVEIRQFGPGILQSYHEVPIAFRVESVFRLEEIDSGLGGLRMTEVPVDRPYLKDYDAYDPRGPAHWGERFDVSRWGIFQALEDGQAVGGAVVAFDTPELNMLEGRGDLAALWDIRVRPDRRGMGIGTRLLRRAADWARTNGCAQLKIETQNVNVRACRFYASRGCRLRAIDRHGYAGDPRVVHEAMLIWHLEL